MSFQNVFFCDFKAYEYTSIESNVCPYDLIGCCVYVNTHTKWRFLEWHIANRETRSTVTV